MDVLSHNAYHSLRMHTGCGSKLQYCYGRGYMVRIHALTRTENFKIRMSLSQNSITIMQKS